MDPELRGRMDEWAEEMHRDIGAIVDQIAANNRRIQELRADLHRDMTAGFDRIMEQFADLQRDLAELRDTGAAP
jgi:hypothetical protein